MSGWRHFGINAAGFWRAPRANKRTVPPAARAVRRWRRAVAALLLGAALAIAAALAAFAAEGKTTLSGPVAARIVRVIDGDTFVADVDLGFHVTMTEAFRLSGVDTPEIQYPLGRDARMFVVQWCTDRGGKVWLRSIKTEKFGRWLAEVYDDQGESLRAAIITAGHGVAYDGGKR